MRSSTRPTRRNKPIVFLFGPTASGKTALVERLFNKGYQIVNADSVQVYRHLDVGSAKPSHDLMERIPHHLVDILDPWQQFTVGQFIEKADEAVERIWQEGDIPLVTGGTAYYFRHFLYGLSQAPVADPDIRRKVALELERHGAKAMHRRLCDVDPVSGARININDTYRITRALEVYYQSGRPLSSFALPDKPRYGMRPLILEIVRDKALLHERIHRRVVQMFDEGLEDEIRILRRMNASLEWPGIGGIGYAEFFRAFDDGCATPSSIACEIERNTKAYAKRQMTFFRSFTDALEIDPDDTAHVCAILDEYLASFPDAPRHLNP